MKSWKGLKSSSWKRLVKKGKTRGDRKESSLQSIETIIKYDKKMIR